MDKRRVRVSFLLTAILFVGYPAIADFEDLGAGARAIGMGNAFVGLADDSRALTANPAGLAGLHRSEFSADYGRLHAGLDDDSAISAGFFSLAMPLSSRKKREENRNISKISALDIKSQMTLFASSAPAMSTEEEKPDIFLRRDLGTAALAFSNLTLSDAVSENIIWLSYGRKVWNRISGGLSIKLLYQNFEQDDYTRTDPVFDRGGRSSLLRMSLDMGLLYNLSPKFFWGLALTDVNRPNVALNPDDRELLPAAVKNGFAFKDRRTSTAFDIVFQEGDYRLHAGLERWFRRRTYAARLGGAIGSRNFKNVTTGFSVNWGYIQIDYGLVFPVSGVQETLGSHHLSLVYRFGKVPVERHETGSIEQYYSQILAEAEVLRVRMEKAESERDLYEKVLVQESLSRIDQRLRAEMLQDASNSGDLEGIRIYVTAKGDTLQSLAEFFFGNKGRWHEIYALNKDKIRRGGRIKTGTVLLIPVKQSAPPPEPPKEKKKEKKKPKPAKPKRPTSYTVQPGDTLGSIAEKIYGDEGQWRKIYEANKDKVEQGSVDPGTILRLPYKIRDASR